MFCYNLKCDFFKNITTFVAPDLLTVGNKL
nr:MAG TPA: hypothetical protein [Caudoviricetes sp.]